MSDVRFKRNLTSVYKLVAQRLYTCVCVRALRVWRLGSCSAVVEHSLHTLFNRQQPHWTGHKAPTTQYTHK